MDSAHEYWSKVFWIVFIAIGLLIISGITTNLFVADIILGLVVVILGLERLLEELKHKELVARHEQTRKDLEYFSDWLHENLQLTKSIKSRHDLRFFRMENRRVETTKRIEKQYRELARRITQAENRMNRTMRMLERRGLVAVRRAV
jgi:5-bromo-4-chloroindolyl phosphate hydrolysis protein